MQLFGWQLLLLLILIQLLQSSNTSFNANAQLSPATENKVTDPKTCSKKAELDVISLRLDAPVGGDIDVPTLTPLQEADVKQPSKQKLAAIVGGIGAALLVFVVVGLVYICLMRLRRSIRRTSETVSSSLSPPGAPERVKNASYAGVGASYGTQNLRLLTLLELDQATNYFSQNNIIGEGLFGLVYKGLLQDGSIVVVKRRICAHSHSFVHEVNHIAQIQHRHLVKLVGYYEDSRQQILVSDYIHNGNVGHHLYDSEGLPTGRLSIQQRLLIALGVAKGLEHLHSLVPPLLHMHFRTNNVLLDESFTAKVSDYGLSKLVSEDHRAGTSSTTLDCFIDPELSNSENFSAESDVYSYGVFLLELVTGREADGRNQPLSDQNLVLQAKAACHSFEELVDKTIREETMQVAEEMFELALQCIDVGPQRPSMRNIVTKLEQIQERDFGHLVSGFSEEIGPVTLGSELFQ